MAERVPCWVKKAGLAVIGIAAVAAIVVRKIGVKKAIVGQFAVPRGVGGWLAARAIPLAHKALYGPAAERLQLQQDDELLDVACGSGVFLETHARHVKRVAGIDLSDIQVKLARKRLAYRIIEGTAEIEQGDATALPWDDGSFTAVTCIGSLEFFDDPGSAVREMLRVLRPGGRLVVSYGIDESDEACVKDCDAWGIPHPPESEARKLFEDAGFSLVDISYLDGGYLGRLVQGVKSE